MPVDTRNSRRILHVSCAVSFHRLPSAGESSLRSSHSRRRRHLLHPRPPGLIRVGTQRRWSRDPMANASCACLLEAVCLRRPRQCHRPRHPQRRHRRLYRLSRRHFPWHSFARLSNSGRCVAGSLSRGHIGLRRLSLQGRGIWTYAAARADATE